VSLISPPPRSSRFPYTTLFRSVIGLDAELVSARRVAPALADGGELDTGLLLREGAAQAVQQVRSAALPVLTGQGDQPHAVMGARSEEHTSELQSRGHLVCRLLL